MVNLADGPANVTADDVMGRLELSILLEKDFQCLIPREGEDQSEHFPNPAAPR